MGSQWSFYLAAGDFEDAEARLAAISFGGKVDGQQMCTIHCPEPASSFVKLVILLRNFFKAYTKT